MKARRVDDSRGSRVQRAALVIGTLLLVWSAASWGRAAEPFFPKVSPLSESRRQELGLPVGVAGMLLEQNFRKLSRGIVIESIVSRVVKPTEFTSQWHREVKSGQILVGYWKRQADGTWDRETSIVGISELMGNTDTDAYRTAMERLEREYAQLTQAEQPADQGDAAEEQIRVPKFRALTDADRRRLHLGQDVTGYLLLDAAGPLAVDTVIWGLGFLQVHSAEDFSEKWMALARTEERIPVTYWSRGTRGNWELAFAFVHPTAGSSISEQYRAVLASLPEQQREVLGELQRVQRLYRQQLDALAEGRSALSSGERRRAMDAARRAYLQAVENERFLEVRQAVVDALTENWPTAQKILLRTVQKTISDPQQLSIDLAAGTLTGGGSLAPIVAAHALDATLEVLVEEGLISSEEADLLRAANTVIQTVRAIDDADTLLKAVKAAQQTHRGLVEIGVIESDTIPRSQTVRVSAGLRALDLVLQTSSATVPARVPSEQDTDALRNLALASNGARATAISTGRYMGTTRLPEKAIDGKTDSGWASHWDMPAWLQVEFACEYEIERVAVGWGPHSHTFSISLSRDGENWTTVVPSRAATQKPHYVEGAYVGGELAYEAFSITKTPARFMRIDLTSTSAPRSHIFQAVVNSLEAYAASAEVQGASVKDQDQGVVVTNSIGIKLALIPAGEFLMGSPDSDSSAFGSEKPQHTVRITKPFYLGVTEVTQEQYERVMGTNPSRFKGEQWPVERVSWNDAVEFCRKLSELPAERSAGRVYRLPTEAEWEYACRAGSNTKWSFGDSESSLGDYAWYGSNSYSKTHPVGQKKPNAWGLYDMHGNVWEWCSDRYSLDYYANSPLEDPTGPATGSFRVFRGGCWYSSARYCRSARRLRFTPGSRSYFLGFRVAFSSVDQSGH